MATGIDPFADLLTLKHDMDRIMEKFGAQPSRAGEDGQNIWMPSVDVFKQGDDMIVRAELPGVNPSDINVSVTGNMLTIKGERRQERQLDENDYVLRETTYGSFERRITMPEDIDANQVRAQYRAGVLEITVPRSALVSTQPRNVAVGGPAGQAAMGGGMQQPASTTTQQQGGTQQQYGQPSGYEQQQGYQPAQPPGREYSQQQEQPTSYQGGTETQPGQEQGQQVPAQVQGGWVSSEQQAGQTTPEQQQAGTYQYGQQEQQAQPAQPEEEPKRSRLGGWLHGER